MVARVGPTFTIPSTRPTSLFLFVVFGRHRDADKLIRNSEVGADQKGIQSLELS
jgi:hypothetical protein